MTDKCLHHVRVENYDRDTSALVQPPLREVQFDQSLGGELGDLPKIELGVVPAPTRSAAAAMRSAMMVPDADAHHHSWSAWCGQVDPGPGLGGN